MRRTCGGGTRRPGRGWGSRWVGRKGGWGGGEGRGGAGEAVGGEDGDAGGGDGDVDGGEGAGVCARPGRGGGGWGGEDSDDSVWDAGGGEAVTNRSRCNAMVEETDMPKACPFS